MSSRILFILLYWIGLVSQVVIRAPYRKGWKTIAKTERRETVTERILLGLMTVRAFSCHWSIH